MPNIDTWLDAIGDWDSAADWSAGVPVTASDVVIGSTGNGNVTLSHDASVSSLTIAAGNVLQTGTGVALGLAGSGLIDTGGTLAVGGTLTFTADANTLTNSGTVSGGSGSAVLLGAGDDLVIVGVDAAFQNVGVDGGTGNDTVRFIAPGTLNVTGFIGFEVYSLPGTGADLLTLTDANYAGVTDATIRVDGGNAGNAIDALGLTAPNRMVFYGGPGADDVAGGNGDDFFWFTANGLSGADIINGGGGSDRLVLVTAGDVDPSGVSGIEHYTLGNGGANNIALSNPNFAGLTGSQIVLDGGDNGNTVDVSAVTTGSNAIVYKSGAGTDDVTGGAGDDIFECSTADLSAADSINGNSGRDMLNIVTAGTTDAGGVSGVELYWLANGGANSLALSDANFAGVGGSQLLVYGGDGGNTIDASTVTGSDDSLVYFAGAGADDVTGGAGADVFRFAAAELTSADHVEGGAGIDELVVTTPGTADASGVAGVEVIWLRNTGANRLTLSDANFAGLDSGATNSIAVYGGNAGNTIDASALTGANGIWFDGGNADDLFEVSAANFSTAGDTVQAGFGRDMLAMTTPGTIDAGRVFGVELYYLANGGANDLLLRDFNFAGVDGSRILVYGGEGGNTMDVSGVTELGDTLVYFALSGVDDVTGGGNDDVFRFAAADLTSADHVVGGAGQDALVVTTAGTAGISGVTGVEAVWLSGSGANALTLTDANFIGIGSETVTVYGGNAGNTIDASALTASNHLIYYGGPGVETVGGGNGSDVFWFNALSGADTINGGGGSDTLEITTPGTIYASHVIGIEVYQLANGGQNFFTLYNANFAGVTGDMITINGGNGGNDIELIEATGLVTLNGGAGDDRFLLYSIPIGTTLSGGAGNDQVEVRFGSAVDLSGLTGIETIRLGLERFSPGYTLTVTDANFTGVSNATITLNAGETLNGGVIDGSALTGSNRLIAIGGEGNDIILAGPETQMTGFDGSNRFTFSDIGNNSITDFGRPGRIGSSNMLVLRDRGFDLGADDGLGTTGLQHLGNSAFVSNPTGSFTDPGQRFAYSSTDGTVYYDADGSGTAFGRAAVATLTDHAALSAGPAGNLFFIA